MFKAIANALGGKYTAKGLRRDACRWATEHPSMFQGFASNAEGGLAGYLVRMRRDGVYGDHLILEALCRAEDIRVAVLKKRETGALVWAWTGREVATNGSFGLYLEGEHYENLVGRHEVFIELD